MNYLYDELSVGQKASFSKTVTETDVYLFAGISGDINPAHLSEEYAKNTFFKTRIAHGLISAGLVSGVLGNIMPGHGTIWISQQLNFMAPVKFGDTITAVVEIAEKLEKSKIKIKAACVNQDGVTVLEGEGIISPPRVKVE
ncbi:MAG: MaoC family dehydratase [Defluviitaleaceae bacterium]|nr:MaoC family dehydratase [Defluviitaleaceae bacterium]MCL2835532.1 MaoC family dehydratase [Defluviitaleaceae bacterium]